MNWRLVLPPTGAILIILILIGACMAEYYSGMAYVDGGQFQMGCDECLDDEKPVHTIGLDSFWIDKYEITLGDYLLFLNYELNEGNISINLEPWSGESNLVQVYLRGALIMNWVEGHPGISYSENGFSITPGYDRYPAMVSYIGAHSFCEIARNMRLPTEAEWEYAARGGVYNQGFRYSGSDDPDLVAWHRLNTESPHIVGQKEPNQLGIYDMSGNLLEWVNDYYAADYYSVSPQENPQGPPYDWNSEHVLRGGSCCEKFNPATSAIEESLDPALVRVTKRSWVMG